MASLDDVITNMKNAVTNLSGLVQSLTNAYPAPTATVSPKATGINTLATTAAIIIAASTTRHGIIFHNPGTVTSYIYPTAIATAPGTTTLGGSFILIPGGTLSFPSSNFPNANAGWSGFAAAGTTGPLTIVEFF